MMLRAGQHLEQGPASNTKTRQKDFTNECYDCYFGVVAPRGRQVISVACPAWPPCSACKERSESPSLPRLPDLPYLQTEGRSLILPVCPVYSVCPASAWVLLYNILFVSYRRFFLVRGPIWTNQDLPIYIYIIYI